MDVRESASWTRAAGRAAGAGEGQNTALALDHHRSAGDRRGGPLLALLIGGLATLLFTLQLLNVQVGQLVLGGAITGILIDIGAQQPWLACRLG